MSSYFDSIKDLPIDKKREFVLKMFTDMPEAMLDDFLQLLAHLIDLIEVKQNGGLS